MVNSHSIAVSNGELSPHCSFSYGHLSHRSFSYGKVSPHCSFSHDQLSPHRSFSHSQLSPIALFVMVNSYPIPLSYGELSPYRSFSHGELVVIFARSDLLLTASDMDPAFEAALIVFG